MKTSGDRSLKPMAMPHPAVTFGALAVLAVTSAVWIKTGFRSPEVFSVLIFLYIAIFIPLRRWSIRKMRQRRIDELEKLRHQSVLHLDE